MIKKNTILLVDDQEMNRIILRGVFEKDYNILEAENGEQALSLIGRHHEEVAAILLDLVMPVMDGYQLMSELGARGWLDEFPVIVITAEDSVENEIKVFDYGASDIIMKPFEIHVVKRRVRNMVELSQRRINQQELIEEQAAKLRESNSVMIEALSAIIEYRSMETGQHIKRIRMFTEELLRNVAATYPEYGLDEKSITSIVGASSMHDIGKIAIPDFVLNKPGKLTRDEFEIMKTHSAKGSEMLAGLERMSDKEYLKYAYNICRYHHERWDGKGYPDGLKGDNIPICAQVVGIADCFDALTTKRVYKDAMPPEQAVSMILNGECGTFSPKLLESLKNVKESFENMALRYADDSHVQLQSQGPEARENKSLAEGAGLMDTLQMGNTKYHALMRYIGSTVMEVDFATGMYHVVYLAGDDFAPLKKGGSFEESIRIFAEAAVHPKDRNKVLEARDRYLKEFFDNGLLKQSRKYRVFHEKDQAYFWYDVTMLRVDLDNPFQKKVIIIWKLLEKVSEKKALKHFQDSVFDRFLDGVQLCRNDQWQTMPEVSASLLSLLGYQREEIKTQFDNKYLMLVAREEREDMVHLLKEQLKKGSMFRLEYPLCGQGGQCFRILDKGQVITGDDGKEYLYRVLTDVTEIKN